MPPEKSADIPDDASGFFIRTGKTVFETGAFLYGATALAGEAAARFLAAFAHPRHFRLPAIVRHIHETGVRALPVIGLMALGISMVVSYQGAVQLRKFGADIYTIDLTVISLLREMGVLATAIMIVGRSGSAFAAEIGVMKLRGEIDAMRTMAINPVETLVMPRLLALLLTLPLLTFFADMVGLAGGGIMAASQLGIPAAQYIARVNEVATPEMFWVGMIKAPVFAFMIALICCYQGLSVSGSAESVGRLTTLAVVQSIFAVVAADAFFSIVFSKLDI
jgi:phospholipid/cholesterol/gamma-HCH transport system permease protein